MAMNKTEFDRFADEYKTVHAASLSSFEKNSEYFIEYKIRDIACGCGFTSRKSNTQFKIMDFGAGTGESIPYVKKYFNNVELTCVDVSARSLDVAERNFPGLAQYIYFDGVQIPFVDIYFDVIYVACVFHHVDDVAHLCIIKELHRVLKPKGHFYIFEHNPFNPLTTHVVRNCPFDEHAHLIQAPVMRRKLMQVGFNQVTLRYRYFFPDFLKAFRPIEKFLGWLPLGGQYSVSAMK